MSLASDEVVVTSAWCQDAELVAVGIGHDDPARRRPGRCRCGSRRARRGGRPPPAGRRRQGERCRECSRFLPVFGFTGGPPHDDLGTAVPATGSRSPRPGPRPTASPSASLQKYPTSCVPSQLIAPMNPAVGEEVVARLDDAELVALGIGEHDVALLRALADVDVPGAELERPRHRGLLVLRRRARQVEVDLVLADLLPLGRLEVDPEPGAISRQDRDVVVGVVEISQPRTPAQKRARPTGSFASKQTAMR